MEAVNESGLTVQANSAAVTGSPLALSGVYLDQREVGAGATVNAEAILTAPAPAGGATVSVATTNKGAVSVPATVTIPAGSVFVSVPITINSISQTTPVVLPSGLDSITASSPILLVNGTSGITVPLLSAMNVSTKTITGGNSLTGRVTLTSAAPEGGTAVALSSSDSAVASIPATVVVPAGSAAASFPIKTYAQAANTTVKINTTLNGESLGIPVTVTSVTSTVP